MALVTLVLLLIDNSGSYLFSRVGACVGLPRFGVLRSNNNEFSLEVRAYVVRSVFKMALP